jgi:hypothetical protein
MMRSKKLVHMCAKIWHCAEKYWCAGAHAKFWCVWKNIGVLVCTLNFGTARKNVGVRVRALKFGAVQKNVGVRCAH